MPIGRKRLTARTIETLKPAAPDPTGKRNGRRFVMDAEVSGLGVKVTETGSRSFVLIKRFPGFKHPAPRQLGSCDALTLKRPGRRPGSGSSSSPAESTPPSTSAKFS